MPARCKGRARLDGAAWGRYLPASDSAGDGPVGINDEKDIEANLQIGPTSAGMVRLFIEGNGIEIPMDFDPDEAEEIAEEIRAAAARARGAQPKGKGKR